MKTEILYCTICKSYTLKTQCKQCAGKTVSPKPAKYSPEDKYGKYRRLYKKEMVHK